MSVSVLVPVTGGSPFLKQTLESILNNEVSKEIVLVNDGVTDDVRQNVSEFIKQNEKIHISLVPNNGKGLVDALNTGLSFCQGEYIARIDSDDLMAPNRLKGQLREFADDPNLLLLGSQCQYVNSRGDNVGQSNYPNGSISSLDLCEKGNLLAHPTVMFRKDIVKRLGGYQEWCSWFGSDLSQDYDLWIRISKEGTVKNSPEFWTNYRQHKDQVSRLHAVPSILARYYVTSQHTNKSIRHRPLKFGKDPLAIFSLTNAIRHTYGLVPGLLMFTLVISLILNRHLKFAFLRISLEKFTSRCVSSFEASLLARKGHQDISSKLS